MRRISLALALIGAVAATGCGQTSKPGTTGGNRGIEGSTFKLTVRGEKRYETGSGASLKVYMLPEGGLVTGNGINCGYNAAGVAQTVCEAPVAYGTAVALQVANFFGNNGALPPVSYGFYGFAGACTGSGTATGATACSLTAMDADRLVLVRFAYTQAGLGAHGPYQDPAVHGAAYVTNALTCTQCHGATLGGAGNAPSCATCHFQAHPQSGFSSPSKHAPVYLAENLAGRNGCGDCHGADLLGANLSPSCGTCHSWPIGPHMAVTNSSHSSGACARCHVGDGFRDYIGVAVSTTVPAADVHELGYTATAGYAKAAALSGAILGKDMKCNMCHNAKTALGDGTTVGTLSTIRFPSSTADTAGVTVTVDTTTAICGQCHTTVRDDRNVQSVAKKLATAAPADPDTVLATGNSAVRPHYLGAATTMLGGETPVYMQFAGNIYTGRNAHGGKAACTDCHNAHTGELPGDGTKSYQIGGKCGACHFDETTGQPITLVTQLDDQRQYGFEGDLDQDGTPENLKLEVEGLKAKLVAALKSYSTQVVGAAADLCFAYDEKGLADQPYVQVDPVTAVTCGTGTNAVAYNQFTTRSLKAAFNYMAVQNDPGAWAHNPRYVAEILFDSINDLNDGLVGKGFTASANGLRAFNGHFGGAATGYAAMVYHAAGYFGTSDTAGSMGFTSAACYQCHGGSVGFAQYLSNPLGTALTVAGKTNALQCNVCHVYDATDMKGLRSDIANVYFPPQKAVTGTGLVTIASSTLPNSFALCGTCHSGRENGTSVDNSIAANYALSFVGTTVLALTNDPADPTMIVSVQVASGAAANGYLNARLGFRAAADGAAIGTANYVKANTKAASGKVWISLATPVAVAGGPAVGDLLDLTFDADTWGIGFTNPHYLGAAAVLLGSDAAMLYQYAGKTYIGKPINWGAVNGNAPGPHGSPHGAACTGCHVPKASKHSFEVDLTYCASCHTGTYALDPKKLEVEEAAAELYTAIQTYATGKGVALCYNGASHPYWFADSDADGTCSTAVQAKLDAKAAKAAFNFKWAHAEPGAYAHNLEYMMEALYDSIEDLGSTPTFTRP